jgi:hypothetical protein
MYLNILFGILWDVKMKFLIFFLNWAPVARAAFEVFVTGRHYLFDLCTFAACKCPWNASPCKPAVDMAYLLLNLNVIQESGGVSPRCMIPLVLIVFRSLVQIGWFGCKLASLICIVCLCLKHTENLPQSRLRSLIITVQAIHRSKLCRIKWNVESLCY